MKNDRGMKSAICSKKGRNLNLSENCNMSIFGFCKQYCLGKLLSMHAFACLIHFVHVFLASLNDAEKSIFSLERQFSHYFHLLSLVFSLVSKFCNIRLKYDTDFHSTTL